MMGIQPSEAKALTWWEYQAMLWTWNDRHTRPEDEQAEAPSADFVDRRMAMLERRGISKALH